jgi:NAD(P)-dependent dehydrogenase (short-subunit alcohol dehydrogenase family)
VPGIPEEEAISPMNTAMLYDSVRPRYPELKDKVAIVTGSSRGIGKGIAIRLAREGMRVVINGRNQETVDATAREFRDLGAEVLAVPADVGQTKHVERLFENTLGAFGAVDLMVNNAASLKRVHFFQVEESLLDRQLANNIKGPFLCAFRAAEAMRTSGGGSIVHISSVGGLRAHWRGLPYDITKGAIDAMTRTMALELADFGIRVNAVAPGATQTERTQSTDQARMQAYSSNVPLRRTGTPLEIGAAVAFLASPDASYITGQIIYVDGGITVQLGTREHPL